jgi:hypothetical protein
MRGRSNPTTMSKPEMLTMARQNAQNSSPLVTQFPFPAPLQFSYSERRMPSLWILD